MALGFVCPDEFQMYRSIAINATVFDIRSDVEFSMQFSIYAKGTTML
jgi:hypothetical protein